MIGWRIGSKVLVQMTWEEASDLLGALRAASCGTRVYQAFEHEIEDALKTATVVMPGREGHA